MPANAPARQARPHDPALRSLAALARVGGSDRGALYDAVARLFLQRGESLVETERDLILDILQRLSRDVETAIRRRLADRLARRGDAPLALVRLLASDEIEVARPVLAFSPVLRDDDLIEIVRNRSRQHQLAVATRRNLSEAVSAALVEAGDEDVIVALLNNADARISQQTLEYLAEEARRIDAYQRPLLQRPDLPHHLVRRMFVWVSEELRRYIVANFEVDRDELEAELSGAVSEALSEEQDEAAAGRLADSLQAAGRITPDFLLQMLQQGQVALFEQSFARFAGLPLRAVQRLLYEASGERLATACRALGIDRSRFLLFYQVARQAHGGRPVLEKSEREALARLYDAISREEAVLLLRRWQRQAAPRLSAGRSADNQ
ncbi:MAG TPA: DUF2336 domain-containing protein [Alphaproteobacteria bacterium]|nr:DUF2336 domain-containing protein [Alphaproteobacteria bacterium]